MQAYFGWAKPCSCSKYCCSRHLWFYDRGRLGRVEIVTLTVGARAKEGKGGGGGEKKNLFSLPAPSPLPLTRPISSSLREVSTWRFREQIARSKKTPALQVIQYPISTQMLFGTCSFKLIKLKTVGTIFSRCWLTSDGKPILLTEYFTVY